MFLFNRYLLRMFFPIFFVSIALFTLFVETLDIFLKLYRYLDEEVSLKTIVTIQYLYLPQSVLFALPVALLFAVSFTMSNLYSHNELIAVYTSGVSLFRFSIPLFILGVLFSIASFFFKEEVVIDASYKRNEMIRVALNQNLQRSNANVGVLQDGGKIVYNASFYDDVSKTLSDAIVIETDVITHTLLRRIDARTAQWDGEKWVFNDVQIFTYKDTPEENKNSKRITYSPKVVGLENKKTYSDALFNEEPKSFERVVSNVEDMRYKEALAYVEELKQNGLSYRKLLTDTYSRIPLAITCFIVIIISCFTANSYGKNTFFMSLLVSLMAAVVYYSVDLIGSVLASRLIIPPIIGAWLGTIVIMIFNIFLYKRTTR